MAYTLMIADDDAMIRKGLSCLIPWQELGFRLAGVFEDGKPLLENTIAQPPDVILIDIRMHEISGLDVARHIWEHHLPTQVIILSGYQDFEYAQQAIRYGVYEYLLKPIAIDKISEAFLAVRQKLDQAYNEQARRDDLTERISKLENRFDQLFLLDAYNGSLTDETAFQQRCKLYDYGEKEIGRQCFLLDILSPATDPDTFVKAVNLIDERVSCYILKRCAEDGRMEGVLIENQPGALPDAEQLTETAEGKLLGLLGRKVEIRLLARYANLRQFSMRDQLSAPLTADGLPRQVESYFRRHYMENVTLNDVAAKLYVNPGYLSRLFHEKTGRTFIETLTTIRMENACRQLQRTELPIAEIARLCGYPDTKYFFKQFKRYIGLSPGEWRAMKQMKGQTDD